MDYYRYSRSIMAPWLFWQKHKSKIPENGQLDTHSDRYRSSFNRVEFSWGNLTFSAFRPDKLK